jgi:hypothetical protein
VLPFGYPTKLEIQVLSSLVLVFGMAEIRRLEAYVFMQKILHGKIATIKTGMRRLRP